MTEKEYNEIAELFFIHNAKYMDEDDEINLEEDVKDYITKINRTIELKNVLDADMYSGVIALTLVGLNYFELSQKLKNIDMYKLTKNGKIHRKIIIERSH